MSSDSSHLCSGLPPESSPARHRPGRHALPAPSPGPRPSRPADGRPSFPTRSWAGPHRDLRLLRRASRRLRRVATFAALGYFAVFLTLTVELPDVMTRPAPGGLPVGLVLALVQLPVTWLAVALFEFIAHRYVDPLARRVRRQAYGAVDGEQRP
ncbi:DUF485 domain-containing protein [Streptomyces sp. NPDC101225]|uniref:DUF485 domain-containing protein n=1 Tax=Streptomyces sp. NPDC101225 TaxID=3366135 RepID=UPI00382A3596